MEKHLEKLVEEGMYLPKVLAAKYRNKGIDYEDLVQEGYIGLIKATKGFDPTREVKFTTYAYFWVRQAIFDAITTKSRTVRLPSHVVSLKLKVYKFTENFILSTGYEPDAELIARELKVDKYLVENILNITTEHIGDWEPIEECTIEEDLEQEDTIQHIIKAIKTLSLKEQLILGMKFGILKSL